MKYENSGEVKISYDDSKEIDKKLERPAMWKYEPPGSFTVNGVEKASTS